LFLCFNFYYNQTFNIRTLIINGYLYTQKISHYSPHIIISKDVPGSLLCSTSCAMTSWHRCTDRLSVDSCSRLFLITNITGLCHFIRNRQRVALRIQQTFAICWENMNWFICTNIVLQCNISRHCDR